MVLTNIGNYNKSSSAIFKDIGISTLTFYFFSPVYRIFGKSFLLDRLTIMKSVNIRFFHIQKVILVTVLKSVAVDFLNQYN